MKRLSPILAKLAKRIAGVVTLGDLFCFVGLALIVTGAAMIYVPAAWIVAGVGFFYLALKA